MNTHSPTTIEALPQPTHDQAAAMERVGGVLQAQDAQWLADLETLERLEQQALYPDACFFSAVGEIVRTRGGHGA